MSEQFLDLIAIHPVLYWLHQHIDPNKPDLSALREPIDAVIGPKGDPVRFPDSTIRLPRHAAGKLVEILGAAIAKQDAGTLDVPLVDESTDHEGARVKGLPTSILKATRDQIRMGLKAAAGRNAGMWLNQ